MIVELGGHMNRWWMRVVIVVGLIVAACAIPGYAQEMAAESPAAAEVGIPFDRAMDMAVMAVYGVLSVMSVGTLALILYFFVVLRKGQIVPEPLRGELMEKIRDGNLNDARRLCGFRRGPLSAVMPDQGPQ